MIERILLYLLEKWRNRQSLKTFGAVRSSEWRRVRAEHLRLHPTCKLCGSNKVIEVHHIKPFHEYPELELEPTNLITLCESGKNGIVCHRAIGHLGSYQSYNADVRKDAEWLSEKIMNRP